MSNNKIENGSNSPSLEQEKVTKKKNKYPLDSIRDWPVSDFGKVGKNETLRTARRSNKTKSEH